MIARRLFFSFLALAVLCVLVSRNARMQSPMGRVTATSEEQTSLNPTVSGDGRFVGFETTSNLTGEDDGAAFHAVRANISSDPPTYTQLALSRAPAPAISQDGSHIAFSSKDNPLGTNEDGNPEIFLYEGGSLFQVTRTTTGQEGNRVVDGNFLPSISDDGRFIAFSSNRDLTTHNADANLEVFVYDATLKTFTQLTNSSGIIGCTDAKISGNGATIAYIRDNSTTAGVRRDLLMQNRTRLSDTKIIASDVDNLALTYGRAISDDGTRLVWQGEAEPHSSQVFLYDGRNDITRQITSLGVRVTEVALQPTISGDGSRIAFATRRTVIPPASNGGVNLYAYHIASASFARVTNGPAAATAEVVSSLSDDGSLIVFNFPRILTGVTNIEYTNNSEIYVAGTPVPPVFGALTVMNGASFGHEPSSDNAVAPDSIAVAQGRELAKTTKQAGRLADGSFPFDVGGTSVTVNGVRAQIFFVSPSQVSFLVPSQIALGMAEVVVTNADGFSSRSDVLILRSSPGIFTYNGDGAGEAVVLDADTLQRGPFDPTQGKLRLILFATGARNATQVSVTAGGRSLPLETIVHSPTLPGLDELHVQVPADLRGTGIVDLVIRAVSRDSNATTTVLSGDASRDIVINEFLADPPESPVDPNVGDANHDGVRSAGDDEFIELVNTTTHDIDIGNYQILTRGGSGTAEVVRHTFSGGTVLPACTAIVVFGAGSFNPVNPAFGGAQVVKSTSRSLNLNNSAGVITLRDQSSNIINLVSYGGSTGLDANANQSLTRVPDTAGNFVPHLTASSARAFSPGTKLDGSPFEPCASVSQINIAPTTSATEVGATQRFTARAFDSGGTEMTGIIFSWQSADDQIAKIDADGVATGVSPGSVEIFAIARGVKSQAAILTVNRVAPALASVTLTPLSTNVGVGETQQFIAQAKDQYGGSLPGVTIKFYSSNPSVADVELVNELATGAATANVSANESGFAELTAVGTDGIRTITSNAAKITVEPAPGQLLISEFRTRGPAGSADEFIEIYNPTKSTVVIGGLRVRASNSSGNISDRVTLAAGTLLGSGCHYLFANNSSSGYTGAAAADQTYSTGMTDEGGIAITRSDGTRILDAVGTSINSAFKEGIPLAPLSRTVDQSYERKPGGGFGNGTDTENNTLDFLLNVGDSNPQNSSAGCLDLNTADLGISLTVSPNPVAPAAEVTYTLNIKNDGPGDAASVVVTDNLPAGVTFVSCAATGVGICRGNGNDRTVTYTLIKSGDAAVVTIVARANAADGSSFSNTATVSAETPDPQPADNSSRVNSTVQSPPPTLSINDVASNEGDDGTTRLAFTVTLSGPAPSTGAAFDIQTNDGSATDTGGDYERRQLTSQIIPAGTQTYMFEVAVVGDRLVENDETFSVDVTNVSGATIANSHGLATIKNDDTADLVLSQIYAGGGNSGSPFSHDFVEIFNRAGTTVDLSVTPYSIQYAGAASNFGSNKTDLTSGVIGPGNYFLVQLASGGADGSGLPTPDAAASFNMASTSGKVALVAGTALLPAATCPGDDGSFPLNPGNPKIVDLVGYGPSANCYEGASGPTAATNNSSAAFRRSGGCQDTEENASDFFIAAAFPRNSSSALNNCGAGPPSELSVSDATLIEGNAGVQTIVFTVSLSAPAPSTDVTFDIATQDGTATAASGDYVGKSLTAQVMPAGQQSYRFAVTVNGDAIIEHTESFSVVITNLSGAVIAGAHAVGTIENDDLPVLTITDVSLAEGNGDTKVFAFAINLSAPAPGNVIFDVATADGTAAVADNDYVPLLLESQLMPIDSSTFVFEVGVKGDTDIEPDETFFVNVTNISGAIAGDPQAAGTIQNDDSLVLTISDVSQIEGDTGITVFNFALTSSLPAPAGGITFDIATADGTAQDEDPRAEANDDYVSKNLTSQTIPAGETNYYFQVTVNGDTLVESNETFLVNVTNVANAAVADGQATGTIQNDDTALLVISQVYAGGGNSGAVYANDFIEIFNRGAATVDFAVTPYSVQYAGATSNFSSSRTDITGGVLSPGHFYLIQEASGGVAGIALPPADATGTINLAATAGKVALVRGTLSLSSTGCPFAPSVADFVGYGSSANCSETLPISVSSTNSNARSIIRISSCVDTNNNSVDFSNPTTAPVARNSATTAVTCP